MSTVSLVVLKIDSDSKMKSLFNGTLDIFETSVSVARLPIVLCMIGFCNIFSLGEISIRVSNKKGKSFASSRIFVEAFRVVAMIEPKSE